MRVQVPSRSGLTLMEILMTLIGIVYLITLLRSVFHAVREFGLQIDADAARQARWII